MVYDFIRKREFMSPKEALYVSQGTKVGLAPLQLVRENVREIKIEQPGRYLSIVELLELDIETSRTYRPEHVGLVALMQFEKSVETATTSLPVAEV